MRTPNPSSRWQLAPPSTTVRVVLQVLVLLLPLGLAVSLVSTLLDAVGQSVSAQPLSGEASSPTAIAASAMIFIAALLASRWLALRLMLHRLSLQAGTLAVSTTFYHREYAWSDLQLDAARIVDLDEHTELKPWLRTNGVSLPGFHSGWFRLRNRSKALVATIGGPRVLYLPTHKGHALLLQPAHPASLLDELKRLAQPPGQR